MQKRRATVSNEIGLGKPILQPTATPRNGCRRIVASEGAGSSLVGHLFISAKVSPTRGKGQIPGAASGTKARSCITTAADHDPAPESASRRRAYIRRILARLPQPSMLHHLRLLFLLSS
jgi:hypothetical protein